MRIILTLGFEAPESWQQPFPKRTFIYRETGSESLQLLREQGARLAVVVFGTEFANDDPAEFAKLYYQFRKAGFLGEFLPSVGEEHYILRTLVEAFYANASSRLTDKRAPSSRPSLPSVSSSEIQYYLRRLLAKGDFAHFAA